MNCEFYFSLHSIEWWLLNLIFHLDPSEPIRRLISFNKFKSEVVRMFSFNSEKSRMGLSLLSAICYMSTIDSISMNINIIFMRSLSFCCKQNWETSYIQYQQHKKQNTKTFKHNNIWTFNLFGNLFSKVWSDDLIINRRLNYYSSWCITL